VTTYYQRFEFSYPDSFLYFDKSGEVARRIAGIWPGTSLKDSRGLQKDLVVREHDIELFYGITRSQIQSLSASAADFAAFGAQFMESVTATLEIASLSGFGFRHVLARPCRSMEEALELMWPLVPDQKERLSALAPPAAWHSLQGEMIQGGMAMEFKIAVMELIPPALPGDEASTQEKLPHITFHLEARGLAPIAVSEFDAAAFIENMKQRHTGEIMKTLAPHLS
jgi:hypothetical protein